MAAEDSCDIANNNDSKKKNNSDSLLELEIESDGVVRPFVFEP